MFLLTRGIDFQAIFDLAEDKFVNYLENFTHFFEFQWVWDLTSVGAVPFSFEVLLFLSHSHLYVRPPVFACACVTVFAEIPD